MLNRKGVELSLNFVIIAIILLIVLIIGILYFTGAINKIFSKQKGITEAQLANEISLQKETCKSYCLFGNRDAYNSPIIDDELKKRGINSCSHELLMGVAFEQCSEVNN